MGPKVSEGAKAYSIVKVNLGLPSPLWGKKTTPDSTQMFFFFLFLNAKASFSCQNWNDWSASFKTFNPILSHLREQKVALILIFLLCPWREQCSLNSPPNYCQHHGDVKSEEATEAGAAVVLLATAGGSPSPKPSLLGLSASASWDCEAKGETGTGHTSAFACRKASVCWRRCRQPPGGGRRNFTEDYAHSIPLR